MKFRSTSSVAGNRITGSWSFHRIWIVRTISLVKRVFLSGKHPWRLVNQYPNFCTSIESKFLYLSDKVNLTYTSLDFRSLTQYVSEQSFLNTTWDIFHSCPLQDRTERILGQTSCQHVTQTHPSMQNHYFLYSSDKKNIISITHVYGNNFTVLILARHGSFVKRHDITQHTLQGKIRPTTSHNEYNSNL